MTLAAIALTFVAVVVLPGMAAGIGSTALAGTRDAAPGVLAARCVAGGVTAWLLTAGVLVRTVGISATSSRVAAVALGIGAVAVLVLPRSRALLRRSGREAAYLLGVAGVTLLAWLPVAVVMWTKEFGIVGSTPWYYWGLARDILETGHFPETSFEFGAEVDYLSDYPLFSSGTAMMMAGVPESAQPAVLNLIVMLGVVTLGVGSAVLARVWGASGAASFVAPPLAVSLGVGGVRLLGYRPEGFALGLSMLVVALFVDWFRRRQRVSLVIGCLLGAVVAQVHGVAFACMAIFLVAATLTVLVVSDRSWAFVRTAGLSALGLVGAVAALGLVIGRVSGSDTAAEIGGLGGTDDPTWTFRRIARSARLTPPPEPGKLLEHGLERLYDEQTWLVVTLVVVGAALMLLQARRHGRDSLLPLVFLLLGTALVVAVACVFVFGWDTYVPRRTGAQRILVESTLLMGVFLACATSALVTLVGRRAVGVGVLAVAIGCSLGTGLTISQGFAEKAADRGPSRADRRALASLDVPDDAVVLANGYTEGILGQAVGGRPLLEGRAPYTFPDQLDRAIELIGAAMEFYRDPLDELDFLDEHDVRYVVVAEEGSGALITQPFEVRPRLEALRSSPSFAEVAEGPGVVVFEYLGQSAAE